MLNDNFNDKECYLNFEWISHAESNLLIKNNQFQAKIDFFIYRGVFC